LDTWNRGHREGKPTWSAGGYLSESQGPLAPWFRGIVGHPDKEALEMLAFPQEPGKLPPALEAKWGGEFHRFVAHYDLGKGTALQPEYVGTWAISLAPFPAAVPWPAITRSLASSKDEQPQLTLAKEDYQLARHAAQDWIHQGWRETPSKLPGVNEKVKETTTNRIANYQKKLEQLSEIEAHGMPAFDRDVWKDKYRTLKNEVAVMRADLLTDLNKPFEEALRVAKFRLSKAQRDKGPVPPPTPATTNLDRINLVTAWGLTFVGACLLLGLLTRPACIGGVCFLLLVYLAMPALPWLPINPRAEGHYQFIDKNIIEMLALLALATTPSGKWLGLDAMLHYVIPFRRRKTAID
jgi:uncharacterized membrane protein YphA (DoxX/SURF4 family)